MIIVFDGGHVVIKNSGDVVLREDISVVADEEGCFANVAVSKQDQFHIEGIIIS